jgi:hypothetical protein
MPEQFADMYKFGQMGTTKHTKNTKRIFLPTNLFVSFVLLTFEIFTGCKDFHPRPPVLQGRGRKRFGGSAAPSVSW